MVLDLDASPILGGPKPNSAEENEPAPIHERGHDTADGKRKKEERGVIPCSLLLHSFAIFRECFSVWEGEEEAPLEARGAAIIAQRQAV